MQNKTLSKIAGLSLLSLLVACGSDSSSGTSGSESSGKMTANASVDETARTITLYETVSRDLCIYDTTTGTFSWNENAVERNDTTVVGYLFVGDTLVIYDTEYPEDYGAVYVGGTPGTIYGKWTMVDACHYDAEDSLIECDSSEISIGASNMTVSPNKVSTEYVFTDFSHYSKSFWVGDILEGINDREFSIWHGGVLVDGEAYELDDYAKKMGIELHEKSNSEVSFEYDGKNVDIRFSDVNRNYYNGYIEFSYAVSVAVGDSLCSISYAELSNITEDLCRDENADYLEVVPWWTSLVGDTDEPKEVDYVIASTTPDKDFEKCLTSAFGFESEETDIDEDMMVFQKNLSAKKSRLNGSRVLRILNRLGASEN